MTNMTAGQKSKQTRTYNENRRNLKIERLIDELAPADLIDPSTFIKENGWRPDLWYVVGAGMPKAYLDLCTWAGCYVRWTGKRIDYEGAGDGDWDNGYKVFPRNLLQAVTRVYDDLGEKS